MCLRILVIVLLSFFYLKDQDIKATADCPQICDENGQCHPGDCDLSTPTSNTPDAPVSILTVTLTQKVWLKHLPAADLKLLFSNFILV